MHIACIMLWFAYGYMVNILQYVEINSFKDIVVSQIGNILSIKIDSKFLQ